MSTEELGSRSERHMRKTELPPTSPNGEQKPKKKRRILLKTFLVLLLLGCIAFLAGVGLFWSYARKAPKLEDQKLTATVSSKIYDSNKEVIEDLGAEKREIIQANDVPQLLKDAIVSVEDKRFYKHVGVDPIRIIGSAFSNIKGSTGLQGGSTLTQQLIKLSFFSTKESDQTLQRKAQEAWLAVQLEREKSKDEIITYYINKVYMANGLYGMETAALGYFNKPLAELNLPQTALLAGMPQAPNDNDPYTKPEQAKKRRDIVLSTMLDNNKITKSEYEKAVATPVTDGLQPLKQASTNRKIVDNYIKEVIAEVERKTGKNVYTDGLDIYTNLDMAAQQKLYDIINTGDYVEYPDADLQVAATIVDVKTGQVKAQIGGRNVPDDVQLGTNQAVETTRDVGSTVKPITVYGPAIEVLDYSTGKIMYDKPTNYPGTNIAVKNADLQYMGPITMRTALIHSRNTTAVETFDAVGKEKAAAFLKNVGIEYKSIENANAISSNTNDQEGNKYGISSLKLAGAYAAFANEGIYNEPYYVNKVIYQDGSIDEIKTESRQAMKDSTAYLMTDMLKDVIGTGTAVNAQIPGLVQAGKTGTSNYTEENMAKIGPVETMVAPDSTFVGYTPNYAISVWTGYKEFLRPLPYENWSIASDVYREMMVYMSQNISNIDWTMPSSVVRIGSELYIKGATQQQWPVIQDTTTAGSSALPKESTTISESEISTTTAESLSIESESQESIESTPESEPIPPVSESSSEGIIESATPGKQ